MNEAQLISLANIFGNEVRDPDWRQESYLLLESFVDRATGDDGGVETHGTVEAFTNQIREFENSRFAFLLLHSGFIPDHYGVDSSQETLHTKLTEAVSCEWGRRLEIDSSLQREKSSREDVTFRLGNQVVVSDTKSFRLGRSQSAPNVKDTIKQGDYQKWLKNYPAGERLGGLITFPSTHDWKRVSDAYSYFSTSHNPILMVFYEHMAYMLLNSESVVTNGSFFSILANYSNIFRGEPSKLREDYWRAIAPEISKLAASDSLGVFYAQVQPLIQDAVAWARKRLKDRIEVIYANVKKDVEQLEPEVLRERLIESIAKNESSNLERYKINIDKFRTRK